MAAKAPLIVTSPLTGEVVEVTVNYLMQHMHVSESTAKSRIKRFRRGDVTPEGLFRVVRMSERELRIFQERLEKRKDKAPWRRPPVPLKVYKRGDAGLTSDDVMNLVPDLDRSVASKRLRKWVAGEIDCDDLFYPTDMHDWGYLGLGPRRNIEDIMVTDFELAVGEEMERAWRGTISREWR